MKKVFKTLLIGLILLLYSCSQESLVWIQGWKETTSLTLPRAGAAVVAANGFIYMIGGIDGKRFVKTTEYAKIQKDGSLGPWKPGPTLNEDRGHAEAVIHNGTIYIAGGANGQNGENLLGSVEHVNIQPDGSMTTWIKEKSSMVLPRRCSKLVVKDNNIYVFGGYGGTMLDTVVRAKILRDGGLGEWVLEPETMNVPHYVNGVKETKGTVYVVGGHAQKRGGGITDVEWSKFTGTGELQPWKETSPLQIARYGLSTAVFGDYLYALGGIAGAKFSEVIERTKIGSNGELAPWQQTTALSQPRATFSTVTYKDWIYVLSGSHSDGYYTSVEYATFNDSGDIGFWGSKEEAAAHKEKLKARYEALIKVQQLPNEGVVKKILQTNTYSYIKVAMKGGVLWLAAPKIELDINTQIRFGEGTLMPNFFSKSLKRTFPKILFVSEVKKVDSD